MDNTLKTTTEKNSMIAKRRAERELLLKLLFVTEFHDDCDIDEQLANFEECFEPIPENVKEKYESIRKHKGEIDMIISNAATGWRLERMGKVELSAMRIAVYEMKFDINTPDKIAVNEAVEVSKKYGKETAGSFVNGVLAKLINNTENGKENE